MRKLRPIKHKEIYYREIEKEINRHLTEIFYKPINEIIEKHVKNYFENSKDYLREALLKGRVQYVGDKFYGSFNSKISRQLKEIGAKWNKKTNTWNISRDLLPMDINASIATSFGKFRSMHEDIKIFLKTLTVTDIETGTEILKTFETLEKDFRKTATGIELLPELTEDALVKLSEDFNQNMNLYIKDWTEENIKKLRDKVKINAYEGYRASNLDKIIQTNFEVSKRKAKFLARQETSLIVSKYKEQRYKSIGATEYEWSAAGDERTRTDHKMLDGNIFKFDNPPIADRKTGRQANPGEDYGCRCIAIPILR